MRSFSKVEIRNFLNNIPNGEMMNFPNKLMRNTPKWENEEFIIGKL